MPTTEVSDTDDKRAWDIALGQAIRRRRRDLELTQAYVAEKMGVTRGLVTQWEAGRSRVMLKDMSRLAEVLRTTASALTDDHVPSLAYITYADTVATYTDTIVTESRKLHQRGFLLSLFDGMSENQRDNLIRAALDIQSSPDEEVAVG